jgi:hypothetical protein
VVGAWVALGLMALGIILRADPAADAAVYWGTTWPPLYGGSPVDTLSYQYSPAFAWWIQPLTSLPFELFYALVVVAEVAALAYMTGPWIAALLIGVQAPLLWSELTFGNVNLVVAALVVMGLSKPWAWAFPILTKIVPGVGLVWFAVRGEWRQLVLAATITVAVALPSLILSPTAWVEWVNHLVSNVGTLKEVEAQAPLWVRWPLAVGIVAWGAYTGRPWTVVLAVVIATPINWIGWVMILGVVRTTWRARPAALRSMVVRRDSRYATDRRPAL